MNAITDLHLKAADGSDADLAAYAGNVLLIVNTASKCGFTPQYAGLQWFYPDFVAELADGGALVVEYKGAGTEGPKDRTEEKEAVGQKWATATGNRFVMARDRDYDAVARALS